MKSIKLHIISAGLLAIAMLAGQSVAAQSHRQGRSSHRTERSAGNSHRSSATQQHRQSRVSNGSSSQRNTRREQGNVSPQNNRRHGQQQGNHSNTQNVQQRPNGNQNRGGQMNPASQHGNNSHFGQGRQHNSGRPNNGSSAMRPGERPHNDYRKPGYQPPRPGGGHWQAPAHNPYYWNRPLPPRPPKYRYARHGIPTIGDILGITFGTFIDYGINTLFNAGYDILGYANNAIYLANVNQLGYLWNNVAMYYDDGLMQAAEFQYYSPTADMMRFNSLYNQLCNRFGQPVSSTYSNGTKSISWWAGNNTGYVTLQYGYANSIDGYPNFYTTLIYGY